MPGHILKRGQGSWSVVVELGRDAVTGKRRQLWRSVKGTKRDAEALLVQLLHERDSGIDQPVEKLTVAQHFERWLTYVKANRAPKTYQTSADIARQHVIPVLGATPLKKLRPVHIQSYLDQAQVSGRLNGKGGLSARSVQRHAQVIHAALQHAVDLEQLARNPADKVKAPQAERREFRALIPEEVHTLFRAADTTPYGPVVRLAVLTGLRQGELLGLRWKDIDLTGGRLSVQQVAQWLPKVGVTFRPPKTQKSRRAVDLGAEAMAILREHRQQQVAARLLAGMAYTDHGLVFATPLGMPIDPSNLRRAWRGIVKRASIGHIRFHDLRHTHASLMLAGGEHLKIVSERLGHASIAITADIYSHVAPGLQAAAATRLELLLANAAAAGG